MDPADDAYSLAQKLRTSEAYGVRLRLEALAANFSPFDRNYHELTRLLAAMNSSNNSIRLWAVENQRDLFTVLDEVARLLQNFLASASALVSYTRNLMDHHYAGTPLYEDYRKKVNADFATDPLAQFIEDLRNYSLHYRLPLPRALLSVPDFDPKTRQRTPNTRVFLPKAALLPKPALPRGFHWTKGAAFLQAAADEIFVDEIASRYYQKVRALHSWLLERLNVHHAAELAWVAEMASRVERAEHGRSYSAPTDPSCDAPRESPSDSEGGNLGPAV